MGNFENSQIFAGEQNILNPKINNHTKTNLKINKYYVMLNPMKYYKISVKKKTKKETNIPFAINFFGIFNPFDITFNRH